MAFLTDLQLAATRTAEGLGRHTRLIRMLRPSYEQILRLASRRRGIGRTVNGVEYRVDPRARRHFVREYDASAAELLRREVRPGDMCVNVGANVGIYVLQFARWSGPDGVVMGFEPNPAAASLLRRHVALNGISDRVEVIESAVGESTGSAQLHVRGADARGRLGSPNPALDGRTVPIEVEVVSLDSFFANRSARPSWLFIDVEGYEIAVLLGARGLIQECGRSLGVIVEMHPNVWEASGTSEAHAADTLHGMGLRCVPLSGQSNPLREHGLVQLVHA